MKKQILNAIVEDKEYQVLADNVRISDDIEIDNAEILVNGKKTDDFGESFNGHRFSTEEVAGELVRSYINCNWEVHVASVLEDILEFAKDFYEHSGFQSPKGRLISKKYLGESSVLELIMIDNDYNTYYTDGDYYILLREDGSVATDMEVFCMNSYLENEENGTYVWKAGAES